MQIAFKQMFYEYDKFLAVSRFAAIFDAMEFPNMKCSATKTKWLIAWVAQTKPD